MASISTVTRLRGLPLTRSDTSYKTQSAAENAPGNKLGPPPLLALRPAYGLGRRSGPWRPPASLPPSGPTPSDDLH
jgi:hypothetical protein